MDITIDLLIQIYDRYRRYLNVDLPECREIAHMLTGAGVDVAGIGAQTVVAADTLTISSTDLSTATPDEPEPPKRGRRKQTDDSTDESGD